MNDAEFYQLSNGVFFENFENFSWGKFIIYPKLSLAGQAQSSVPGELNSLGYGLLDFKVYWI